MQFYLVARASDYIFVITLVIIINNLLVWLTSANAQDWKGLINGLN